MGKIIRLTENDLTRLVRIVIMEQGIQYKTVDGVLDDEVRGRQLKNYIMKNGWTQKTVRGHKFQKYVKDGGSIWEKNNKVLITSPTDNYFYNGVKLNGPFNLKNIPNYIK
jgi:hypothetical protein